MHRRSFLKTGVARLATGPLFSQAPPQWGGPVLDTHLHLRKDADACFTHMQGCGVSNAVLLTLAPDEDRANQEMKKRPGVFARSVSADPAAPDADKVFRSAIQSGAVRVG